ncbi:MAG: hypothetical protein RLZZ28_2166 [Bacteroidota bacterium]|jgi:hypothetical protein
MLKKFFTVCIGISSFLLVNAQQDSTKKSITTIIGSVDAYYRYNFENPPGKTNNLTAFTNSKNSFELGMASIRLDHSYKRVSATVDLGFGKRAQEFSYNDVGTTLSAVKQAYIGFAVSDKVKISMGKWATHVGYELMDAYANRNYSMGYAFSYGPFFHTGIKADISLGGKTSLMVGVADPTDYVSAPNDIRVAIAQISTASKNDKIKAYLNFQGASGLSQFDLVLTALLNEQFNVVYNGTILSSTIGTDKSSWNSNVLYLNYDPVKSFGLTLRGEYFSDRKLTPVTGTGNIFAATLSGNLRIDNLTIIPELRLDNANTAIFTKSDGGAIKNTSTFLLAAVYKF